LKFIETIIVEGKYDKAKLAKIVDSNVISTNGFDIYRNAPKREMIRKIAHTTGIIIFTDSDAAGKRIRQFIKNFVGDGAKIINAYIPEILGKEKRKSAPSKEGKLGLEGISVAVLKEILAKCPAHNVPHAKEVPAFAGMTAVSLYDLYELGLVGSEGSSNKRKEICQKYNLPRNLSTKQFLEAINVLGIEMK